MAEAYQAVTVGTERRGLRMVLGPVVSIGPTAPRHIVKADSVCGQRRPDTGAAAGSADWIPGTATTGSFRKIRCPAIPRPDDAHSDQPGSTGSRAESGPISGRGRLTWVLQEIGYRTSS